MGRVSQIPRAVAGIETPAMTDRSELQTWRPYQDVNITIGQAAEQPGCYISFVQSLSELSELSSDAVNTLYAPREHFTSRRLQSTHESYQQWYRRLPQYFWLENTSLPYVIVLHMYYYACVLRWVYFKCYPLDISRADIFDQSFSPLYQTRPTWDKPLSAKHVYFLRKQDIRSLRRATSLVRSPASAPSYGWIPIIGEHYTSAQSTF